MATTTSEAGARRGVLSGRPHRSLLRCAALAATLGLCACRDGGRGASPPPADAGATRPFSRADVAAAAALDAKLARVTLLATELSVAAEAEPSAARALAPRLATAVVEAEGALAGVVHPADRPAAEAAVGAARRWPALAIDVAEADGGSQRAALGPAREALGRAVFEYRRARTTYVFEPARETQAEADFGRARTDLERTESAAGARLPVAPRDEGHKLDPGSARLTADAAVARARGAAAALEPALRDPALRFTEAEGRALSALQALGTADPAEQRRRSLDYQAAKVDALDAIAELEGARARR